MRQRTLRLLDRITSDPSARQGRPTELLKGPHAEVAEGWYMCVGPCFNAELDIRRTERVEAGKRRRVWTQGALFGFQAGDTIYDTIDARKIWSEALKTIRLCVQVRSALPVGLRRDGTGRFAGFVRVCILTPDGDRSRLVERGEYSMSQDDFVRLLISGLPDSLKREIGGLEL